METNVQFSWGVLKERLARVWADEEEMLKRVYEKNRVFADTTEDSSTSSGHRGHRRTFEIKSTPANAGNYDFVSARPPGKKTNVLESVGHLVKSCLGGGVVAIHESYKACGLWTSMVLTIFIGFLISYCMYMIAKSAHRLYGRLHISTMSYPDVAEAAIAICPFPKLRKYSKCLRYAVDFTICVDLFGSCCVYQVVICRTIKQLVEGTDTVTLEGNPPLRVYILMLLIPCILICMITTLKYLAPFSILADVFLLILACATVYYGCLYSKVSIFEMPAFKNMPGLFEFLGVCVFSMEGVGVTMAIENNMKEPKKIGRVLALGMSVVVGIVFVIGTFGYWGFGEDSKSPVTLNFPFTAFSIALKVFMAIIIYVTFALNFWVPFDLVWFYIKKRYPPSKYWLWERVYRGSFVVVITLIAFVFPNVSAFIGLLGSFCLSNMGFIYPAFIELCVEWEYPGLGFMKWRLFKWIFICIFGVFLGVFGTYTNAKELIRQSF
ncbi:Proton-coupled amino acid transporter 1 [Papilio machaon]|uniref:Proton-coupled amino acid transporter 1 n=1 Tax=Papilio machaon TaxID=76193 RepID=A0A0N1PIH1_PAPMA|nr:Proton-coupled amino acid transporter 1 [Papilio machaon]